MNVLVVDDEKIALESLHALLSICDFEVQTASNGEQALQVADTVEPDVAVIDLILGGSMDGLTVADQLTKIHPALNVIIISGRLDLGHRTPQNSQYKYLVKPFQLSKLLASIQSFSVVASDNPEPGRNSAT